MDVDQLRLFLAVAQARSLSEGARRLRLPLSTASRRLAALEEALGAVLLDRTGRGVRPTAEGRALLERLGPAMTLLDDALGSVGQERPKRLRVTAPVELGHEILPPIVEALLARWPALQLDVHLDPRRVSLIEEDYDVAVRVGALDDSGLLAARLGDVEMVLCGAPAWAERVAHPDDIAQLAVLTAGMNRPVDLTRGAERVVVRPGNPLRMGTFFLAGQVCERGVAPAWLSAMSACEALASGRLVRLLPEWRGPRTDVHAVFGRQGEEVRAFVELAREAFVRGGCAAEG